MFSKVQSAYIQLSAVNIFVMLLCSACSSLSDRSINQLESLATANAYEIEVLGDSLPMKVLMSPNVLSKASVVNVYIGGDGAPWGKSGKAIAANPTAYDATTLALMQESEHPAIFLTRPCYYLEALPAECKPSLWTSARYSHAIVDEMALALEQLVVRYQLKSLQLVGYSGGATLAVLLAARNDEGLPITKVVSVAGNLNVRAWVSYHRYLPLAESLDAENVLPISLPHLVLMGERDINVPPSLYLGKPELAGSHTKVEVLTGYAHVCCWLEQAGRINDFLR